MLFASFVVKFTFLSISFGYGFAALGPSWLNPVHEFKLNIWNDLNGWNDWNWVKFLAFSSQFP